MKPYEKPPTDINIKPIEALLNLTPKSHLRVLPLLSEKTIINPFFHKLARKTLKSDEQYLKKYEINNVNSMKFRNEVLGSKTSNFIKMNTYSNNKCSLETSSIFEDENQNRNLNNTLMLKTSKVPRNLLLRRSVDCNNQQKRKIDNSQSLSPMYKTYCQDKEKKILNKKNIPGISSSMIKTDLEKYNTKKKLSSLVGNTKPKTRKKVDGTFNCRDVKDLQCKIKDSNVYRKNKNIGNNAATEKSKFESSNKDNIFQVSVTCENDSFSLSKQKKADESKSIGRNQIGIIDKIPYEDVNKYENYIIPSEKKDLLDNLNFFFKKNDQKNYEMIQTENTEKWFMNKLAMNMRHRTPGKSLEQNYNQVTQIHQTQTNIGRKLKKMKFIKEDTRNGERSYFDEKEFSFALEHSIKKTDNLRLKSGDNRLRSADISKIDSVREIKGVCYDTNVEDIKEQRRNEDYSRIKINLGISEEDEKKLTINDYIAHRFYGINRPNFKSFDDWQVLKAKKMQYTKRMKKYFKEYHKKYMEGKPQFYEVQETKNEFWFKHKQEMIAIGRESVKEEIGSAKKIESPKKIVPAKIVKKRILENTDAKTKPMYFDFSKVVNKEFKHRSETHNPESENEIVSCKQRRFTEQSPDYIQHQIRNDFHKKVQKIQAVSEQQVKVVFSDFQEAENKKQLLKSQKRSTFHIKKKTATIALDIDVNKIPDYKLKHGKIKNILSPTSPKTESLKLKADFYAWTIDKSFNSEDESFYKYIAEDHESKGYSNTVNMFKPVRCKSLKRNTFENFYEPHPKKVNYDDLNFYRECVKGDIGDPNCEGVKYDCVDLINYSKNVCEKKYSNSCQNFRTNAKFLKFVKTEKALLEDCQIEIVGSLQGIKDIIKKNLRSLRNTP